MINHDEAFELDVVGAMACSTPVIAMNRDMVSELIRD
jgi:glycosyltransferase involved in cell wall biosynthesis